MYIVFGYNSNQLTDYSGAGLSSQNGDSMDLNFILIAGGITIAWVGLVIFYMRVVSRQRKLYQELQELNRMIGPEEDEDDLFEL